MGDVMVQSDDLIGVRVMTPYGVRVVTAYIAPRDCFETGGGGPDEPYEWYSEHLYAVPMPPPEDTEAVTDWLNEPEWEFRPPAPLTYQTCACGCRCERTFTKRKLGSAGLRHRVPECTLCQCQEKKCPCVD